MQTGTLKTESPIRALSWNLEGSRLLTAGCIVQLWHLQPNTTIPEEQGQAEHVKFTVGGECDASIDPPEQQTHEEKGRI